MPTSPRLRPMSIADLDPTVAAILADEWGDRRAWFAFAIASPACRVFVAEIDGEVVGTGVATINGPVGWLGTIWVAPTHRGHGLGRELTQATIDAAESAGCRSLVLVATERGRPLYERLGFEVQTWYRTFEARGVEPTGDGAIDDRIRSFQPTDLVAMATMDRLATGEDRREVLSALASPAETRVVAGEAGLAGFLVRAPWGGGATIAARVDDAIAILRARRRASGPDRRVRCGILLENSAGAEPLEADGWVEAWRAPRLVRGDAIDWRPEHIWGQFNHAMG